MRMLQRSGQLVSYIWTQHCRQSGIRYRRRLVPRPQKCVRTVPFSLPSRYCPCACSEKYAKFWSLSGKKMAYTNGCSSWLAQCATNISVLHYCFGEVS